MRRSFAAALSLLLPSAPLSAQVLLRINPPEGQVTRYRIMVETYVTGGQMAAMMTDPSQPMNRMTMYQTRAVTAKSGDRVTFRETIDSATMESPAMPQMAQMMGQATAALRGMVTEQVMTTRGKIVSSQVVSGGPQGMGPMGQGRGRGGPGGPMGNTSNRENGRMLVLLPERPVRVGDSWTDTMTTTSDAGAMTMIATFRLDRMEGSTAVLGFTGTMSSPMGQEGTFSMQMTGELRLDTSTSRMGGYRMEMQGSPPAGPMGDMQMRIRVNGEPIG